MLCAFRACGLRSNIYVLCPFTYQSCTHCDWIGCALCLPLFHTASHRLKTPAFSSGTAGHAERFLPVLRFRNRQGLQEAGGTWTKEMAPVKEALGPKRRWPPGGEAKRPGGRFL